MFSLMPSSTFTLGPFEVRVVPLPPSVWGPYNRYEIVACGVIVRIQISHPSLADCYTGMSAAMRDKMLTPEQYAEVGRARTARDIPAALHTPAPTSLSVQPTPRSAYRGGKPV